MHLFVSLFNRYDRNSQCKSPVQLPGFCLIVLVKNALNWILSLVSLFTNVASEILYPVMPIYLKTIGFSIILIGVLEGFAEAIAGLSKGYFGALSDNKGKRLPFV